jgi:hypothetical protein
MSAEENPMRAIRENRLALLADMNGAKERLVLAANCISELRRYRDTVNKLEQCSSMEGQIAEQALGAEQHSRILIKVALDCLNDLMDSGSIDAALVSAAKRSDFDGTSSITKSLDAFSKFLTENFKDQDFSFFSELKAIFDQHKTNLKTDHGGLMVSCITPDGRRHSHRIEPSRRGDLGRMSAWDVFSGLGTSLTPPTPARPARPDPAGVGARP